MDKRDKLIKLASESITNRLDSEIYNDLVEWEEAIMADIEAAEAVVDAFIESDHVILYYLENAPQELDYEDIPASPRRRS